MPLSGTASLAYTEFRSPYALAIEGLIPSEIRWSISLSARIVRNVNKKAILESANVWMLEIPSKVVPEVPHTSQRSWTSSVTLMSLRYSPPHLKKMFNFSLLLGVHLKIFTFIKKRKKYVTRKKRFVFYQSEDLQFRLVSTTSPDFSRNYLLALNSMVPRLRATSIKKNFKNFVQPPNTFPQKISRTICEMSLTSD